MQQLYIFDFDDTLAITDSQIKLIRGGEDIFMTSHEFANYRAEPGDELDFSDFGRVGGTLISDTVREMERAIGEVGVGNVFIVTARSIGTPVRNWLENHGITSPTVVATAGSAGKAPWLAEKLQSGEYSSVTVFEDCRKNIRMLKDTVDDHNTQNDQNVAYGAMCILPNQSMVKVESRWRPENVLTEDSYRNIIRNFIQNIKK